MENELLKVGNQLMLKKSSSFSDKDGLKVGEIYVIHSLFGDGNSFFKVVTPRGNPSHYWYLSVKAEMGDERLEKLFSPAIIPMNIDIEFKK